MNIIKDTTSVKWLCVVYWNFMSYEDNYNVTSNEIETWNLQIMKGTV
jgi:hypothetical protein